MSKQYLEVIFIDDWSQDNSVDIIKENGFSVVSLTEPSGAPGKPRNIGIQHATGEYLLFLDADDLLEVDSCEFFYNLAKNHDCDMVKGTFTTFDSKIEHHLFDLQKNDFTNGRLKVYKSLSNIQIQDAPFLLQVPNNLASLLFKREFINSIPLLFPEGVIAQDAYFVTHAYLAAKSISFEPKKFFKYRIRENENNLSVTQKRKLKYFQDWSEIRRKIIHIYEQYNILDYFDTRYSVDVRWILNQFEFTADSSSEDQKRILQEMKWFIDLSKKHPIEVDTLTPTRRIIFESILESAYEDAIPYMKKSGHSLLNDI